MVRTFRPDLQVPQFDRDRMIEACRKNTEASASSATAMVQAPRPCAEADQNLARQTEFAKTGVGQSRSKVPRTPRSSRF
jgi:hypothetical protein